MNGFNANKEFISNTLTDSLNEMQIRLSQHVGDLADFGFVSNENTYCVLSIISLLNHAMDNAILFDNTQWDNIILLYNKVSHV